MKIQRDVVPLALLEKMGEIRGKTRFQKLMFLLQQKSRILREPSRSFRYDLHYYGPFSADLEATLNEFASRRMVDIHVSITPEGHPLYIYRLTAPGRQMVNEARSLRLVTRDTEREIEHVRNAFGHLPLKKLIAEAYKEYGKQ